VERREQRNSLTRRDEKAVPPQAPSLAAADRPRGQRPPAPSPLQPNESPHPMSSLPRIGLRTQRGQRPRTLSPSVNAQFGEAPRGPSHRKPGSGHGPVPYVPHRPSMNPRELPFEPLPLPPWDPTPPPRGNSNKPSSAYPNGPPPPLPASQKIALTESV